MQFVQNKACHGQDNPGNSQVSMLMFLLWLFVETLFYWNIIILEPPTFDDCQDPWIFNNWLHDMDQLFEQVGLSNNKKVWFAKMKLIGRAMDYWNEYWELLL